jgi:hypothetical protein
MGLKEKLLENKRLNEETQYKVSEQQSQLSYQLGYDDSKQKAIDYSELYDPFVKIYSNIQISLQNNTSENPAYARKYADDIMNSVNIIKTSLENIASNVEAWTDVVQKAGLMGGVDLMGTPESRYKCMNVLAGNLKGEMDIKAEDDDINKLAFNVYDDKGFVEKIYLNKLNELSERQDMFVSIPDVAEENQNFKMLNPEIFEQEQKAEAPVLTGGVTETYRKKDAQGQVELKSEDIGNNMVQDFYTVDKELIKNNLVFNIELDKISAGILGEYESSDQAIAFNNNILAEVTDYYLKPAKALTQKEKEKFQENYKNWFLEKEIGNKFPLGEPKPKNIEQPQEEIVEEQVQEEVVLP